MAGLVSLEKLRVNLDEPSYILEQNRLAALQEEEEKKKLNILKQKIKPEVNLNLIHELSDFIYERGQEMREEFEGLDNAKGRTLEVARLYAKLIEKGYNLKDQEQLQQFLEFVGCDLAKGQEFNYETLLREVEIISRPRINLEERRILEDNLLLFRKLAHRTLSAATSREILACGHHCDLRLFGHEGFAYKADFFEELEKKGLRFQREEEENILFLNPLNSEGMINYVLFVRRLQEESLKFTPDVETKLEKQILQQRERQAMYNEEIIEDCLREFRRNAKLYVKDNNSNLRFVFNNIDEDKDGKIGVEDFKKNARK